MRKIKIEAGLNDEQDMKFSKDSQQIFCVATLLPSKFLLYILIDQFESIIASDGQDYNKVEI